MTKKIDFSISTKSDLVGNFIEFGYGAEMELTEDNPLSGMNVSDEHLEQLITTASCFAIALNATGKLTGAVDKEKENEFFQKAFNRNMTELTKILIDSHYDAIQTLKEQGVSNSKISDYKIAVIDLVRKFRLCYVTVFAREVFDSDKISKEESLALTERQEAAFSKLSLAVSAASKLTVDQSDAVILRQIFAAMFELSDIVVGNLKLNRS